MVFSAHGSHDSMCRSVPQIPVLRTRIRTSLIPISGRGTSRSSSPGPAFVLTSASIVAGGTVTVCPRHSTRAPNAIGREQPRSPQLGLADASVLAGLAPAEPLGATDAGGAADPLAPGEAPGVRQPGTGSGSVRSPHCL